MHRINAHIRKNSMVLFNRAAVAALGMHEAVRLTYSPPTKENNNQQTIII